MYHDLSKGLEKLRPKGLIDCPPSVKKPRLILIYTEKAIPDKDWLNYILYRSDLAVAVLLLVANVSGSESGERVKRVAESWNTDIL